MEQVQQFRRLLRSDPGKDNADAHIKQQIMGRQDVVAGTRGAAALRGKGEIFNGKFDARMRKRVLAKFMRE